MATGGFTSGKYAYLSSIRTQGCGTAGPVYSARGRISRLFDSCASSGHASTSLLRKEP